MFVIIISQIALCKDSKVAAFLSLKSISTHYINI